MDQNQYASGSFRPSAAANMHPPVSLLCGASAGGIDRGLLAKARASSVGATGREDKRTESTKRIPQRYYEYQIVPVIVFVLTLFLWVHLSYAWGFGCTLLFGLVLCLFNLKIVVVHLHGSHPRVLHVSTLCLAATFLGGVVGLLVAQTHFYRYAAFQDRMQYVKIKPDHPAVGLRDAAGISFDTDAVVGRSMVVGITAFSDIYCVAPIVKTGTNLANAPPVQFWAVGMNCCEYRYNFRCGTADVGAHAGLVHHDFSGEVLELLPMNHADRFYRKALEVATSLYPITSNSSEALLVEWTRDAQDNSNVWWGGFWQAALATVCFSLFVLPLACVLSFQYESTMHKRLHQEQHF
eukprot:g5621.t1